MARARRTLLVAPSEMSTGEAVTLLSVAKDLRQAGASCTFVASQGASRLIEPAFAGRVRVLGHCLHDNQKLWNDAVEETRPDAIVFADYPLLFFKSGNAPLADDHWVHALERNGCALFTLDHLGYAQKPSTVAFGPAHLTVGIEVTAALPSAMEVLLPCPINDPAPIANRIGRPFSCGVPQAIDHAKLRQLRARYVEDDDSILVLHSTPSWAIHLASALGLPHHRYLSQILADMFVGLGRPVTIVSVSAAGILAPTQLPGLHFVNVPSMPPEDFECLIAAADLMLTDNAVSVSLGKAVSLGRPSAVLVNGASCAELFGRRDEAGARLAMAIENERPGAIFPWEVFPIWNRDDLQRLGFGDGHAFRRCAVRIEAFDGAAARAAIAELVGDSELRRSVADAQRAYMQQVAALPAPSQLLASALT